ncbi:MAG: Do family serine endopeptidase [Candidatus Omnitrophota bacterium]
MTQMIFKFQKQSIAWLFFFSLLFVGNAPLYAQTENPAKALAHAFRQAVEKVIPAVVSISAEKNVKIKKMPEIPGGQKDNPDMPNLPDIFKYFFPDDMFRIPQERKSAWQGSGVLISPKGEIMTNVHVVDSAEKLTVTLDNGDEIEAEVVAVDKETDVALIKLKQDGEYSYAKIGDSDQLMVGDWVLAIGNPFGLSQSVSQGIVSAKGRTSSDVPIGGGSFTIKDYIQTTAAINPGNSGGPLINIDGEIVGINNAIQTAGGIPANIGIGFAIPSNLAKFVIDNLREFGRVKRGYIGVKLSNLDVSDVAKYYKQEYGINHGALIAEVMPDTPGAKAGLEAGDLIIEYNGEKVKDDGALVNMVTKTPVGSTVTLTILRQGKKITKEMVLTERPSVDELAKVEESSSPGQAQSLSEELLDMAVETLTPEKAKEKGYDEKQKGVLVTKSIPGGAAFNVGIQPDDVIEYINEKSVENALEFKGILEKIKEKMTEEKDDSRVVMLRVNRAGGRGFPRFIAPTITLDN